tara:strand:+ start:51 stop:680 length:630 start_codon:yes stop_codon:yes gene_type:complete
MAEPIKKAKYPEAAEWIYENVSLPGFTKTYVPGESELTSRLLGIEPRYEYSTNVRVPKEMYSEKVLTDKKLWDAWVDKSWEKLSDKVLYSPEESPLEKTGVNEFTPNPETKFGKGFQDRLDLAFTQAVAKDIYAYNPDRNYKLMLKGKEELLGDVYFDEEGNFEDKWNVSVDRHEPILTPTNLLRRLGSPLFEMNTPVIKGKATYRGYK